MNTFLILTVCGCISLISASLPQNIHDSEEARLLFHLADKNSDYLLTPDEFHSVFLSFDLNHDQHLSSDEFLQDWTTKNLGSNIEAVTLFHHLDVNKDGVIEETIDLPWIIKFFDRSEDGHINESEFVVQWTKIKSADNYYHHSYVDHASNNYQTKTVQTPTKSRIKNTQSTSIMSTVPPKSSSSSSSSMIVKTSTIQANKILSTTTELQPTSCYLCSGPTYICEQRFHSEQCANIDQQYCINKMVNNRDGTRTLDRRCATKAECENEWKNQTSHRSECTNYKVTNAYAYQFECSFCCHGSDCNQNLIPKNLY